jgi:hypothetical protein
MSFPAEPVAPDLWKQNVLRLMMRRERGKWIVLIGLLAGLVGCGESGPKLEPVSGQVLKDGKAMTNVAISMVPEGSGIAAMGSADSSGTIVVQTNGRSGAMQGRYKIGVTEPTRPMTPQALASGSPPPLSFDRKYESPQTSGFEFEVLQGGGKFEFSVTPK